MVNAERSVIANLEPDRLQEDDKGQDHPNRGEHYAGGRIREFCAHRLRNFDHPIQGTLEPSDDRRSIYLIFERLNTGESIYSPRRFAWLSITANLCEFSEN